MLYAVNDLSILILGTFARHLLYFIPISSIYKFINRMTLQIYMIIRLKLIQYRLDSLKPFKVTTLLIQFVY